LQGLQRITSWQLETFPVFIRILMDLFLDPIICQHAEMRAKIVEAVNVARRAAAEDIRRVLQGNSSSGDDSLPDVFFEEWEVQKAPLANINELCSSPRRLVGHRTTRPDSGDGGRKVMRRFLLLRRLSADLARFTPQAMQLKAADQAPSCFWDGPSEDEAMPLRPEEESADGFSEGMSFEVRNIGRIVCSTTIGSGRHTRYLLLHDFLLLLVEPDLSLPGWVVVKTLWPLRQVQSLIDRSDPRTMIVGMQSHRGPAYQGAEVCAPACPSAEANTYRAIMLHFDDVKRCHTASVHIQRRRQEVRSHVLRMISKFID